MFIVLGMLLIVVALAGVILNIIRSQARFTHHQASRIQAYYASQAGINYAIEMLRTGGWVINTHCLPPGGCLLTDPDFPAAVASVNIIRPRGTPDCPNTPVPPGGACISTTATYTYIP